MFWNFQAGQRTFEQEILQGKTLGNGPLCDEKGPRPASVECTGPSYVLTADEALTKAGADVGPVTHQIPRWQYFVGALNNDICKFIDFLIHQELLWAKKLKRDKPWVQ